MQGGNRELDFIYRLEIDNYDLDLLFQAFDASGIGPDYDYNDLPWELAVMRNYKAQSR